jgi:hypothetical protein
VPLLGRLSLKWESNQVTDLLPVQVVLVRDQLVEARNLDSIADNSGFLQEREKHGPGLPGGHGL